MTGRLSVEAIVIMSLTSIVWSWSEAKRISCDAKHSPLLPVADDDSVAVCLLPVVLVADAEHPRPAGDASDANSLALNSWAGSPVVVPRTVLPLPGDPVGESHLTDNVRHSVVESRLLGGKDCAVA